MYKKRSIMKKLEAKEASTHGYLPSTLSGSIITEQGKDWVNDLVGVIDVETTPNGGKEFFMRVF
jgi:hypothetical protein